jgi:hypothetical protein
MVTLLVVLTANVLFLAVNLAGWAAPAEPLLERVRTAFATGDLLYDDWRPFDRWRGYNQYNDCIILLLATDRSAPLLSRAVGPVITSRGRSYSGYCETLAEVARAEPVVAKYRRARYARYWHGYVPVTVALLQVLELERARHVLKATVYAALLLLLVAAGGTHRGLRLVAGAIALTGLMFWGLPYFGQSPSHGPGDAFVILGIAALFVWREELSRISLLVPFCAAYGAGVVYLEFLTGLLPTAAGLLIPTVYLIAASRRMHGDPPGPAWRNAILALLAFSLGAGLTFIMKQVFAVTFLGWDVMAAVMNQLQLWTGLRASSTVAPSDGRFFMPLMTVLGKGAHVLTYGSKTGAAALFAASTLAWVAAAWLALRSRERGRLSDFAAFAAGTAVIAGWILLFPSHTYVHTFMVRMFMVPIALGWAALAWQVWSSSAMRRSPTDAFVR